MKHLFLFLHLVLATAMAETHNGDLSQDREKFSPILCDGSAPYEQNAANRIYHAKMRFNKTSEEWVSCDPVVDQNRKDSDSKCECTWFLTGEKGNPLWQLHPASFVTREMLGLDDEKGQKNDLFLFTGQDWIPFSCVDRKRNYEVVVSHAPDDRKVGIPIGEIRSEKPKGRVLASSEHSNSKPIVPKIPRAVAPVEPHINPPMTNYRPDRIIPCSDLNDDNRELWKATEGCADCIVLESCRMTAEILNDSHAKERCERATQLCKPCVKVGGLRKRVQNCKGDQCVELQTELDLNQKICRGIGLELSRLKEPEFK